ncbi:uncharacterized protein LOC123553886 [Mercenaria mercenaria]|uniref:uncharacterized protein LOC123553886 n=1 Tax=Mercenaria mercenaria TaxID=6596 RepID=UPI00234FB0AD|nr:uncharacterized protein LOC123553886 [Mercenaria mercenaria]
MDRLLTIVTCIYYLAFYVAAIPIYNTEKTSLQDVYNKCNSAAANKVIFDSAEPPSNFLLDMRNENDVNAIIVALTRNDDNNISDVFGKKLSLLDQDLRLKQLLDTMNDLRRECIFEYISEKRPTKNMKKDAEKFENLDPDNFSDLGIKELLSTNNGYISESVKRNRAIGLNPTGWRKRRSDSRDTEDLTKFLRNMRELLEKRERLSFNPTGW